MNRTSIAVYAIAALTVSVIVGMVYGNFHFAAEQQLRKRTFLCATHDIKKGTILEKPDLGERAGDKLNCDLSRIIRTKEHERFILVESVQPDQQRNWFVGKPAPRDLKNGEPLTIDDQHATLTSRVAPVSKLAD